MKEYEFALRFSLANDEAASEELIERLGNAGCDDALIGIGRPGRIALEFAREAPDARQAILSAIADVVRAIPEARLIEITPDLAGVSDVAQIVGCSRQNMRELLISCGSSGPMPVHEGKWALWHLSPVLHWLRAEKNYDIDDGLLELTDMTMRLNTALDAVSVDPEVEEDLKSSLSI